jgi:DUF1680 family protein
MQNIRFLFPIAAGVLCLHSPVHARDGYPITPVPFTSVMVGNNSFWGQRLQASRDVTISLAFSKCKENGRYENFVKAASPSEHYDVSQIEGYPFDDTDVYKTIEGASYQLQTYPDKKLQKYIDSILAIVSNAQEPDGYLYTARTMNPAHPHSWSGTVRWSKEEEGSHELYNLGHMLEGACAHYQATGQRNFLDIAIRYADCVCRAIGPNDGQLKIVPGHEIAGMGLCKLFLLTGDKKYLKEAKFFVDERGRTKKRDSYGQANKPLAEQDEVVGHAVRAMYYYSGVADVAALTGDTAYIHSIDRLWENCVGKKYYITGGVGARPSGEAFGDNYELPNETAYCETCAAIGNIYWNYRLFLLHGKSKYYDVLERTLYNALIAGVSLDGGKFFYPNPLASTGDYERQAWFGCACCPSNICRFMPSLPGYVYAVKENNVYINLFMDNTANLTITGKPIGIRQETDYPEEGLVKINISEGSGTFGIKIRIPSWALNHPVPGNLYSYADTLKSAYSVLVNGQVLSNAQLTSDGYYTIIRTWNKGDQICVNLDMDIRTVKANDMLEADRGRVSVERGPIVYCAEWPDNSFPIFSAWLNRQPQFSLHLNRKNGRWGTISFEQNQIQNAPSITTDVESIRYGSSGKLIIQDARMTLIPYYSWAHRGQGEMEVWLPIEATALQTAK